MSQPTLAQLIVHAEIAISPAPLIRQCADPAKLDYFQRICHKALELLQAGVTLEELEAASQTKQVAARVEANAVLARLGAQARPSSIPKIIPKISKEENTRRILEAMKNIGLSA